MGAIGYRGLAWIVSAACLFYVTKSRSEVMGCYYIINIAQRHLSAQAHKREYHVIKIYYTLFIHAIFNTARLLQAIVFLHVY